MPTLPESRNNANPLPVPRLAHASLRRRVIKSGLAAAPVLMTLTSRPVLGCDVAGRCTTPSAFGSVNTSRHGDETSACTGLSPGYWKEHTGQWPDGFHAYGGVLGLLGNKKATLFHSAETGFNDHPLVHDKTVLQVLDSGGGGVMALARHISAALFNAIGGRTPVLSPDAVRGIWNEFVSKGYFEPTAGIKWGASDIVKYLDSTMT